MTAVIDGMCAKDASGFCPILAIDEVAYGYCSLTCDVDHVESAEEVVLVLGIGRGPERSNSLRWGFRYTPTQEQHQKSPQAPA